MNTKILENLGKKLREIRKGKGLTQEQLAEKVSIHPTYVGKLEGGKITYQSKCSLKFQEH